MAPPFFTEIRLVLVLAAMFFLPGAALLAVSGAWRRWVGLQQFVVAVGLSLSFFPILFYGTRFILPSLTLTPLAIWPILVLALVVTIWGVWRQGAFSLRLDWLEWVALILLGLTLLSRFWFANVNPFPAWSDSLHHTLLTELTAVNGSLPNTLEPYFPNRLDMYHLGLYALSGTAQMLAQAPAHNALLWTAQFLNGLCGLGIYLILDKYAGRSGAVVGLAVAGLFSVHPALWANWGRFTQLASLVVLPISWTLMLDIIIPQANQPSNRLHTMDSNWLFLFTAATIASVFLYHFRVAVFFALLLMVTLLWALREHSSRKQRVEMYRSLAIIGGLALLFILPVLWDAATVYFARRAIAVVPVETAVAQQTQQSYYEFPLSSIPYLAAPIWLLVVAAIAGLAGIIWRNKFILVNLAWTLLLILLGNLYRLNIPALNVTNLGAILIMLYLPISLIIGASVTKGLSMLPQRLTEKITVVLIITILAIGLPAAWDRGNTIEAYRHFMTEEDMTAMNWINAHIPQDATFAINTYFWLPNFAHGTDAGYWIPYLTDRHIITSSMLSDGLTPEYRQQVRERARAAEVLEKDISEVTSLYDMGVQYIYIGARGDFSGPGLPLVQLSQSTLVELLYLQGSTAIFRIKPPG